MTTFKYNSLLEAQAGYCTDCQSMALDRPYKSHVTVKICPHCKAKSVIGVLEAFQRQFIKIDDGFVYQPTSPLDKSVTMTGKRKLLQEKFHNEVHQKLLKFGASNKKVGIQSGVSSVDDAVPRAEWRRSGK